MSINGKPFKDVLKEEGLYPYPNEVTVTSSSDKLVEVISREGVGAFIGQGRFVILVFSRLKN